MVFALCSVIPMMAEQSVEVQAVLNILRNLYGHKIISSSMANVDWNCTEAENVFKWTGKYPAMNTFDFIHYEVSADVVGESWIDYSDMTVINNWWQQGGLVSCMWHWGQPNNAGTSYTCTPGTGASETSFDPSKINNPSSPEYAKMVKDLDQIAGYLQQMQALGIPVIWRPFHEAAGNTNVYQGGTAWFWWGIKGSEVYKQLWQFMYNYFTKTKGLNNLIWVWNGGVKDDDWYPGDNYVDIVSIDYYGSDLSVLTTAYQHFTTQYPQKLVALAECGNLGDNKLMSLETMWNAGCKWMYAMPWYDYYYNAAESPEPSSHDYYIWYVDAMGKEYVVDRCEMKQLITMALAGEEDTSIIPITMPHFQPEYVYKEISGNASYSLSGQRINDSYKGVVIKNGKKYLRRP